MLTVSIVQHVQRSWLTHLLLLLLLLLLLCAPCSCCASPCCPGCEPGNGVQVVSTSSSGCRGSRSPSCRPIKPGTLPCSLCQHLLLPQSAALGVSLPQSAHQDCAEQGVVAVAPAAAAHRVAPSGLALCPEACASCCCCSTLPAQAAAETPLQVARTWLAWCSKPPCAAAVVDSTDPLDSPALLDCTQLVDSTWSSCQAWGRKPAAACLQAGCAGAWVQQHTAAAAAAAAAGEDQDSTSCLRAGPSAPPFTQACSPGRASPSVQMRQAVAPDQLLPPRQAAP